jgi:phage recombination protein Bet
MNALTTQSSALALSDEDVIDILTGSLYPGANRQSVKLVLGYCKAAGLDPMQKPVHIVPMWDSKAGQMRDVVMPGVGLYRTQASRTGNFAGQTEPEFGPMITMKVGGVEITYPEWAKVTVKKTLSNGTVAEFTAVEYWVENYAVKGGKEKSIAPNAMWSKRPRGQIAKCAAAQALRLAFPEMGAQPTAEEMEGKTMHDDMPAQQPTGEVASPELVRLADAAAIAGEAAYQKFWSETGKDNRKLLGADHEARKAIALKADAKRTVEADVIDVPADEHEDVSQ